MFQGKKVKIKTYSILFLCFQKEFNPLPPSTLAGGSVTLQSPRPHRGAVEYDGSCVGAGGLQCFKKK
jgi:hypothetical protein